MNDAKLGGYEGPADPKPLQPQQEINPRPAGQKKYTDHSAPCPTCGAYQATESEAAPSSPGSRVLLDEEYDGYKKLALRPASQREAEAMTELVGPKRRFEITITAGADEWEALVHELKESAFHVADHGLECSSVSGGPSSHHTVTIHHNPEQTHEKYFEELDVYLAARKEAESKVAVLTEGETDQ